MGYIKHMQTRVSEEEYKEIRKAAIDAGLDVEEFLKQCALEKVRGSTTEKEEEKEDEVLVNARRGNGHGKKH